MKEAKKRIIVVISIILSLLLLPIVLGNLAKAEEGIDIKIENWTNYDLHVIVKTDYETEDSFILYSGNAATVHTYEKGYHVFSIDAFDDTLRFTAYDTHYTDRDFRAIIRSSGRISFYDTGKSTSEDTGNNEGNEEEGCFIATAAYGTDTAKGLDVLRSFRDNILLSNPYGRILVKAYYFTSPPIAHSLSQHEYVRDATRILLVTPATIVVAAIINPISLLTILSVMIAFILLSWRFKKFDSLLSVLKGIGYGTLSFIIGVDIVLTLGWMSAMSSSLSNVAIYILPIMLPMSIGVFIWIIIRDSRLR